jgi:acyl carrier protein
MFMPANLPTPDRIAALLADAFGLTAAEAAPDAALFSAGRLDSFHLIELLGRLETEFGVKIGSGEVSLENLDTTRRMAEFLGRKQAEAGR